jgi:hypothetical protein
VFDPTGALIYDQSGSASRSRSAATRVVGAEQHPIVPGSAYVFVRSGTVWNQQQKLLASDAAAGDSFGESVAISGETVVAGARADFGEGVQGLAYGFVRSGATWSQQQKLLASDSTSCGVLSRADDLGFRCARELPQ